jgi:hypothetical protein
MSKFNLIRQKLHLNQKPWTNFPTDLLHAIFDRRDFVFFNKLELLGDRILEVISTDLLLDNGATANRISKIKHELVRNSTFICFFLETDLCKYVYYSDHSILKNCADSFEALIGALYHYQRNIKKNPSAFSLVESYVKKWWLTTDRVNRVLSGQRIDECQYNMRDIRTYQLSTHYVPNIHVEPPTLSDFNLSNELTNPTQDVKDSLPPRIVYNIDRLVKNGDWRGKTLKAIANTKTPYPTLKGIYAQLGLTLESEILPDPDNRNYDLVVFPIDILNMNHDVLVKSGPDIRNLIKESARDILNNLVSQFAQYVSR